MQPLESRPLPEVKSEHSFGNEPDNRSFAEALARASAAAAAATVPAVLGAWLHHESLGSAAAFGAYLIAVTHPELPAQGFRWRLASSVVMLSLGAQAGAAAGLRPWAFLPVAVLGASWQAWTEVADTGLRLPAALAVLAMLLSSGNIAGDAPVGRYGLAFAVGAAWQALVLLSIARRSGSPDAAAAADWAALAAAPARGFIVVMAALGLAAAIIVLALPVPNAVWLLTAALRVMKPTRNHTVQRLRHRFIGTAAGAAVSGGLYVWQLPALLHAAILGFMLTVMLLIGARRYAAWTFCLTVIALDLGARAHGAGWHPAEDRLLLTIGGLAMALLFSRCLPRSSARP